MRQKYGTSNLLEFFGFHPDRVTLDKAIRALPSQEFQAVVRGILVYKKSVKQVALETGLTYEQVRGRYQKALKTMLKPPIYEILAPTRDK